MQAEAGRGSRTGRGRLIDEVTPTPSPRSSPEEITRGQLRDIFWTCVLQPATLRFQLKCFKNDSRAEIGSHHLPILWPATLRFHFEAL